MVIEFLRRLRAATTPQDYFELHRDLFRRFKARQDHIGALKTEQSAHQERRTQLAAQTPRDIPAISAAQREASAVAEVIEVEEALLSTLRVIGDGIALDVEDLADLMLGYLDLLSLLNVDVLEQQFSERGISVTIAVAAAASSNFLVASRRVGNRELVVYVDPTLREQLLAELMRPETAIASVKAVLDAVEAERSPKVVERIASLAEEASVWESRRRSS